MAVFDEVPPGVLDPRTAGMLAGAFGLMQASGPSRMPVSLGQAIGQGGMQGLGTYQQAMQQQLMRQQQMAQMAEQKRLHDAQIKRFDADAAKDAQAAQQAQAQSTYLARPDVQEMIRSGNIQGVMSGMPNLTATNLTQLGTLMKPKDKAESDVAKLMREKSMLPAGDPRHATYDNAIRKASETAKQISPTIVMPSAPSMTEVVDPKDPSRLLRVDAKRYRGGSIGDIGVLGISGKEPVAAKREEKAAEGKDLLKVELDNLREHYRVLNEARAITSDARGVASNAASWVQSSGAGQLLGRMGGTKEQTARNEIQSSRLRVMNAIKNATGMSAQQLNSNVELKTWLDSLTSFANSYESNIGILDAIEDSFVKGKGKMPSSGKIGGTGKPRVVDW